jgi:hypothetical protein
MLRTESLMRLAVRVDRAADRMGHVHVLLAVSSIAAGVIHAAVVREHLSEEWVFGVFFILAAGFQIAWAIAIIFRPTAIVYATGALTNGSLIGIWVVSRTVGLPIGPHTWMPEAARALDVSATFLEILLLVGSLVLVRRGPHAESYGLHPDFQARRAG